jgi:hypothetical protein
MDRDSNEKDLEVSWIDFQRFAAILPNKKSVSKKKLRGRSNEEEHHTQPNQKKKQKTIKNNPFFSVGEITKTYLNFIIIESFFRHWAIWKG